MANTTASHWQELVDYAEQFVPGWAETMFIYDALVLAWKREKALWWELYLQAEELGWA